MTLWCIARSPLMLGADLSRIDEATLAYLTNDEVLAVNQASANNRQLFRDAEGRIGWIADVPGTGDKYLALFNARDPWVLGESARVWQSAPVGLATEGQSVAFEVPVNGAHTLVLGVDDGDTGRFWWPAVWRDVRWVMADGREQRADREYGSHGEKVNGLRVPEGAVALRGTGRLDDAARERGRGETMVFSVYRFSEDEMRAPGQKVTVPLAELGLGGAVRVRDLWARRDLGRVTGEVAAEIEWHGARLYRVSSAQ
jgi:hypothetical protein